MGHRTRTGRGAIQEAGAAGFGLILLDLGLPDLDGSKCVADRGNASPAWCW
jgi:DNA-binding response OmpR family regulator